jgi:thiol peroxidase
MATITLKGNPIHTMGQLPAVGTPCPDFQLVAGDLSEATWPPSAPSAKS